MTDPERQHLITAAASLDDRLALGMTVEQELDQLERCLKFEDDPTRRKILRRAYLALTDKDGTR